MSNGRLIGKSVIFKNAWIALEAKEVAFSDGRSNQDFYSLKLPDYVCVIAETPEGHFPLVRQYRPAVEEVTWEFPSGTRDDAESPAETARRELREETGLETGNWASLGKFTTDVGRLDNRMHAFHAKDVRPVEGHVPEAGIVVRMVSFAEIEAMILAGEFNFALHVAVWSSYLRRCRS